MTSDDTPKAHARAVRADVRRNRARLLAAARETFQRDGADASLEGVARTAGVGIGTLYRHFPTRQHLLEALLADVYADLAATARELLIAPAPGEALMTWLRAFASRVTVFRGLAAAAVLSLREESLREERPEPGCPRRAMCEAGEALFARAQRAGDAPAGTAFADVLWLTGAIAAVTEREPEAAGRLLSLAAAGMAPGAR
ncbi:helix-turn-helix domain-containing protein [Actinomadura bangladeshensis]|uniref:TetR/AcrR family transcriptional regulator n=1 Tax=Actinomadura bangladeshensis TaxID=453573 RepID=UPI0030B824A3